MHRTHGEHAVYRRDDDLHNGLRPRHLLPQVRAFAFLTSVTSRAQAFIARFSVWKLGMSYGRKAPPLTRFLFRDGLAYFIIVYVSFSFLLSVSYGPALNYTWRRTTVSRSTSSPSLSFLSI
jgi:hypothetical protein